MTRMDFVAKVQARVGWKALTADEYQDDGYAFLSTPNIKARDIDFAKVNFISKFRYDESPELKLQVGDVLLAKDGSTLGIANTVRSLPRPATVNGSIAVVRPFDIDPIFLTYWLQSRVIQGQIQQLKDGMGVPHLFQADIRKLPVPRLGAAEQRKIAHYLDDRVARIDRIIAARRAQLSAIIVLSESRRDHLLAVVPSARRMQLRRLICVVQTGPFGSQLHSDEYVAGGWPVVNPACLSQGRIRAVPGMAVGDEVRSRLQRHVLQKGDIVFGRRGELGRAGLVTDHEVGWVCGTGSLLVRLKDQRVMAEFVTQLLSTSAVRYYFQQRSVGSTMDSLNTEILLSVPLQIPSLEHQGAVLESLAILDAEITATRQAVGNSIDLLHEYKQSLITAAVTGELDVATAGSGIPG